MQKVHDTQRRGLAGMGGRGEETTNAWDPTENSVAQKTSESNAKDVFRFHPQAPSHLSYKDKRERRQIHLHVYSGSLRSRGGHIDLDSIESEALEILENDPGQAERFFGNRCKSGTGSWLKDGLWDSRLAPRLVRPKTKVCLGFDGSDSGDWTGIRAETLDGYSFTPTYGPDDQPTIWNPKLFDGEIPRGEVNAAVDHLFNHFVVVRMYCDVREWKTDIEGWQLKYGDKRVVKWETNRVVQMHESLKRFVADLKLVITHDDCHFTKLHIGNARKVAKPGDRYILGKPIDHQKIDLAMCTALAHEARCDAVAGGARNTTSNRRVVVSTR